MSVKLVSFVVANCYFFLSGPIGLVNLLTAKACGASQVAVTGK